MKTILFAAIALIATAAGAQTAPRSASDAANAFSLDLAPAPTPTPDPVASPPGVATDRAPVATTFTLDTPIAQLIADPRAKAVLDKDIPGLSDDSNLAKFQSYSLRRFQPLTGGQMTNALLAKTGADLMAIGGPAGAASTPAPYAPLPPQTDKRFDSGR